MSESNSNKYKKKISKGKKASKNSLDKKEIELEQEISQQYKQILVYNKQNIDLNTKEGKRLQKNNLNKQLEMFNLEEKKDVTIITESHFQSYIKQDVQCLGCQIQLQQFIKNILDKAQSQKKMYKFEQIIIDKDRRIGINEDILNDNQKVINVISQYQQSSEQVKNQFSELGVYRKGDLVGYNKKKNYRCLLHSHKPVSNNIWNHNILCLLDSHMNDLNDLTEIDEQIFLHNLQSHLKKRKFCQSCKDNIMNRYNELKDAAPDTDDELLEDNFCDQLEIEHNTQTTTEVIDNYQQQQQSQQKTITKSETTTKILLKKSNELLRQQYLAIPDPPSHLNLLQNNQFSDLKQKIKDGKVIIYPLCDDENEEEKNERLNQIQKENNFLLKEQYLESQGKFEELRNYQKIHEEEIQKFRIKQLKNLYHKQQDKMQKKIQHMEQEQVLKNQGQNNSVYHHSLKRQHPKNTQKININQNILTEEQLLQFKQNNEDRLKEIYDLQQIDRNQQNQIVNDNNQNQKQNEQQIQYQDNNQNQDQNQNQQVNFHQQQQQNQIQQQQQLKNQSQNINIQRHSCQEQNRIQQHQLQQQFHNEFCQFGKQQNLNLKRPKSKNQMNVLKQEQIFKKLSKININDNDSQQTSCNNCQNDQLQQKVKNNREYCQDQPNQLQLQQQGEKKKKMRKNGEITMEYNKKCLLKSLEQQIREKKDIINDLSNRKLDLRGYEQKQRQRGKWLDLKQLYTKLQNMDQQQLKQFQSQFTSQQLQLQYQKQQQSQQQKMQQKLQYQQNKKNEEITQKLAINSNKNSKLHQCQQERIGQQIDMGDDQLEYKEDNEIQNCKQDQPIDNEQLQNIQQQKIKFDSNDEIDIHNRKLLYQNDDNINNKNTQFSYSQDQYIQDINDQNIEQNMKQQLEQQRLSIMNQKGKSLQYEYQDDEEIYEDDDDDLEIEYEEDYLDDEENDEFEEDDYEDDEDEDDEDDEEEDEEDDEDCEDEDYDDDDDDYDDEDDDDDDGEDDEYELDIKDELNLLDFLKFSRSRKKIYIPWQKEIVHEILRRSEVSNQLQAKHANNSHAVQQELLICLANTLKDAIQTYWKETKSEEIVRFLFLKICSNCLLDNIQNNYEMIMQKSGYKTEIEEFLSVKENTMENKKEKRKRKKNRQKEKKKQLLTQLQQEQEEQQKLIQKQKEQEKQKQKNQKKQEEQKEQKQKQSNSQNQNQNQGKKEKNKENNNSQNQSQIQKNKEASQKKEEENSFDQSNIKITKKQSKKDSKVQQKSKSGNNTTDLHQTNKTIQDNKTSKNTQNSLKIDTEETEPISLLQNLNSDNDETETQESSLQENGGIENEDIEQLKDNWEEILRQRNEQRQNLRNKFLNFIKKGENNNNNNNNNNQSSV